jgi:hypothetical protein
VVGQTASLACGARLTNSRPDRCGRARRSRAGAVLRRGSSPVFPPGLTNRACKALRMCVRARCSRGCLCSLCVRVRRPLWSLRVRCWGGRWGLACTGCASGPTGGSCACVSAVPHVRVAGLTGGANYVEGYTTYCVYRVILFLTHTHTYGYYEGQGYRGGYIGIMEDTCS